MIKNGFKLVIYANQLLRAAYPAMVSTAKTILMNSRAYEIDKKIIPIWEEYLDTIRKKGLSVGAKIFVEAKNVPAGLGEPVYSKLDSDLASAMISINAVKGVEIGLGNDTVDITGAENSDELRVNKNKKIIFSHPPDIIFVYSTQSAISFIDIVKKYSLYPLMTGSKVMCISDKIASLFKSDGWKKVEVFNPGEEIFKL